MDPQNAQTYIPVSSDSALGLLHRLFGTPVEHLFMGSGLPGLDQAAASTAATLGAMFGWFNGGVLFFGTIIVTWVTVFGVTNTSNDGVALGRKWNTFYTPLRTLTATAFLIPSTTGYSGIQLLVLQLVLWSCGFASLGWGVYVERAVVEDVTITAVQSVVDDSSFDNLAVAAIRMQTCAYATSKAINAVMPGVVQPLQFSPTEAQRAQIGDVVELTTTVSYTSPNWSGSDEICGKVQIGTRFFTSDTNDQQVAKLAGPAGQLADDIAVTRYKFIQGLFGPSGVQPISNKIIAATEGGPAISAAAVRAQISDLRKAMLAELRNTVRQRVAAGNAALVAKLAGKGWVSAGSLYMEVSRIKDAIHHASKMNAEVVPGAGMGHLLGAGEVAGAVNSITAPYDSLTGLAINKALATPESIGRPALPSLNTNFTASDFMDGGNGIRAYLSRMFKSWGDNMVRTVVYTLDTDSGRDMIWQIKDLGDNIAGYSEAALVATAALNGALEGLLEAAKASSQQSVLGTNVSIGGAVIVGAIAGVKGLFVSLFAMISQGLYALLYLGYFLGIWLPMVPFYIFTIGVVGWLVVVVEAMIASSLWMVMHLTPDSSDSFIGGQQQGYLLLLSVFMRPALMVFGLVVAVIMLNPVVAFVNESFLMIFRVLQADSTTGLFSVAGYILGYTVVIFGSIMLIFSLPQTLPDRILKWIGAGIGDLGEQSTAQRIEQTGSNQARTAMIAGSGAMKGGAGRAKDAVRRSFGPAMDEANNAAGRGSMPEGHSPSSLTIGPGNRGGEL